MQPAFTAATLKGEHWRYKEVITVSTTLSDHQHRSLGMWGTWCTSAAARGLMKGLRVTALVLAGPACTAGFAKLLAA